MTRKGFLLAGLLMAATSLTGWAADKVYPNVEKYVAQVSKMPIPLQEAINKVMEEYGGIPVSGSLEMNLEDGETRFVFWIEMVKPGKNGKPASVWSFSIDAETGELMSMENATREKEQQLRAQEKEMERDRREQEKERQRDEGVGRREGDRPEREGAREEGRRDRERDPGAKEGEREGGRRDGDGDREGKKRDEGKADREREG